MIEINKTDVYGWETAIRGMRNPLNSWDKSDSDWCNSINEYFCTDRCRYRNGECEDLDFPFPSFIIGENDEKLMKKLINAGSDHGKFMRMITVYVDITAPLYWWKEFDTYKIGTVANSCSTMHKIADKEFTIDDFSHEHLVPDAVNLLMNTIEVLNEARDVFINYDKYYDKFKAELISDIDKKIVWWQMIQLLPSSYNQKRTVMLNYEVLKNMYHARKNHKLDEWRDFCEWIETLPYSELITGKE